MKRNLGKGRLITSTTAVTGNFSALLPLTACVLSAVTSQDILLNATAGSPAAADWGTLPAGIMIEGTFTSITLTSGKMIAYE